MERSHLFGGNEGSGHSGRAAEMEANRGRGECAYSHQPVALQGGSDIKLPDPMIVFHIAIQAAWIIATALILLKFAR